MKGSRYHLLSIHPPTLFFFGKLLSPYKRGAFSFRKCVPKSDLFTQPSNLNFHSLSMMNVHCVPSKVLHVSRIQQLSIEFKGLERIRSICRKTAPVVARPMLSTRVYLRKLKVPFTLNKPTSRTFWLQLSENERTPLRGVYVALHIKWKSGYRLSQGMRSGTSCAEVHSS